MTDADATLFYLLTSLLYFSLLASCCLQCVVYCQYALLFDLLLCLPLLGPSANLSLSQPAEDKSNSDKAQRNE